jgi:hypothetical protein
MGGTLLIFARTAGVYIGMHWDNLDPEDWTAEHEADLPGPFQTDRERH